ncbi:hypothetical protein DFP73DRAFT_474814, partial [Morchella snyderi]
KDSSSSVSPRFPSRLPPSPTASALPIKTPHHRTHSIGSVNTHRITRRKSMSSTAGAANMAAVVQAVKEAAAEIPFSLPAPTGLARSPGKAVKTPILGNSGYPSPPSSLPTSTVVPDPTLNGSNSNSNVTVEENLQFPRKTGSLENGSGDSAIAEGYGPDAMKNAGGRRRASEGAHLVLGGAPGGSRARSGSELKCDKCGKGYKHSSCLTKHLWEHTPEWSYTSKLLISKHQQVQLLEAASILVSMNPSTTPPTSNSGAEHDSSSSSSEDTTPPPHSDIGSPTPRGIRNGAGKPGKRLSGSYPRSSTAPNSTGFPSHFVQKHTTPRQRTRITPSEDEALASAIELLSCSFRTIGSPQPSLVVGSLLGRVNEVKREEEEEEDEGDVSMVDLEESGSEVEGWGGRRGSDEDEDGVFGRMEE